MYHTVKHRAVNWIRPVMCSKWFLKHVVVRKAEEKRKRGISRKQLLDDLKNRRRYWNL